MMLRQGLRRSLQQVTRPASDRLLPSSRALRLRHAPAAGISFIRFLTSEAVKTSGNVSQSLIMDRVISLQSELGESSPSWINRVSAVAVERDGPFRIAVVGESHSGTESLVNALLENRAGVAEVVPDIGLLNEGNKIHKIGYGESHSIESDPAGIVNIKLKLDWLQTYNAELICSPAQASELSLFEDSLFQADMIIFVTDALRPFTSTREMDFLEKFVHHKKSNIVLAVNNIDHLDNEERDKPVLISKIKEYLKELQPVSESSESAGTQPSTTVELPEVFLISTRRAHLAQSLPSASKSGAEFIEQWNKSGLQSLKSIILSRASSANRTSNKFATSAFVASQAVRRLHADQEASIALLTSIKKRIENILLPGIIAGEQRLHSDFEKKDLATIPDHLATLTHSIRTYFASVNGILRLIFKAENIADDVKTRMKANTLLKAEYQMTYAVGRLNEGLFTLYERTRAELVPMISSAHPLSAYPATKAFQADVARIIEILDKQRPPAGVEVDAFALRNMVANFDETEQADALQESVEKLVRRSLASQVMIISGGAFATYLGVPWAISIPSTLIIAAGGFGLMKIKWSSLQDNFISKIGEAQKSLQGKLLATYDRDFNRVVADPLSSIVKLLEEALKSRRNEAEEGKKKAEELLQAIEDSRLNTK
ncbi:hypothetical protein HDV05_004514 [Chytridiales sp. JEL 0842]|nr:hypothetical protein HDV05_004514 [Chytridiales sp. JEL 0842]